MTTPFSARRTRGFTLIEILVVITIIVLLMALAGPALVGALQGNKLSAAGQNMVGRLSQAQQLASAQNLPVELRFYSFVDNTQVITGSTTNYGAYQFVLIHTRTSGGVTTEYGEPLASPYYLESSVFIITGNISTVGGSGGAASPLLTASGGGTFLDDGSGPGAVPQQIQKGTGTAQYAAIRFLPNGEVKRVLPSNTDASVGTGMYKLLTLNLNQAYFTLVGQKDLTSSGTVYNYYAIQLDPYTGHVRIYQPSLQ